MTNADECTKTNVDECTMVGQAGWEPVRYILPERVCHSQPVCVYRRVALAGRVIDAQTGKAIAGAWVSISNGPKVFTAADGHFHFLDLPAGNYKVKASLPGAGKRYGQSGQVEVSVSQDNKGKYTLVKLPPTTVKLPPTTIKGKITHKNGEALAMAEVRVQGSGERTFSDVQGNYLLTGLEVGKRTVRVSAQGYWEITRRVQLKKAGEVKTSNFALPPKNQPKPGPPPSDLKGDKSEMTRR